MSGAIHSDLIVRMLVQIMHFGRAKRMCPIEKSCVLQLVFQWDARIGGGEIIAIFSQIEMAIP